ncbi:hypothetical protein B0I32_14824 [Nonomuraea fuscirosea]|uniref:Uncharacterized protein n=1 Tax=Nonomuraea fuscirosea TaxID=1291556 RepID=A0A2T0LPR0_9ACTN|nr:hypothetical protein B0I32_14824 [Nonomuraea fuscirosea]
MASIDKTAYPRFKRTISERELREAYSPTLGDGLGAGDDRHR